MTHSDKQLQRRKEENDRISKGIRGGTYEPPRFDSQASFFPARPNIKKDKKLMAKLHGETHPYPTDAD